MNRFQRKPDTDSTREGGRWLRNDAAELARCFRAAILDLLKMNLLVAIVCIGRCRLLPPQISIVKNRSVASNVGIIGYSVEEEEQIRQSYTYFIVIISLE